MLKIYLRNVVTIAVIAIWIAGVANLATIAERRNSYLLAFTAAGVFILGCGAIVTAIFEERD